MTKLNWVQATLVGLYTFGIFVDWAYWIATGFSTFSADHRVGEVLVGWLPALGWPLHIGVMLWQWVLI